MSAPLRFSKEQILGALDRFGGNKTAAAAAIGMSVTNLSKRLQAMSTEGDAHRARGHVRNVAIPRAAYDAAREASFDLAYAERRDWRAEDVIRAFFVEAFDGWLERKVHEARAKAEDLAKAADPLAKGSPTRAARAIEAALKGKG